MTPTTPSHSRNLRESAKSADKNPCPSVPSASIFDPPPSLGGGRRSVASSLTENPLTRFTDLDNLLDLIAHSTSSLDQLCQELGCTKQNLHDFLSSVECQLHIQLQNQVAQIKATHL